MIKHLTVYTFLLLTGIASDLAGQDHSDSLQKFFADNHVLFQTVTVFHNDYLTPDTSFIFAKLKYDKNGNLIERISYDKDGSIFERYICHFTVFNTLKSDSTFGPEGKLKTCDIYFYDGNNLSIGEVTYDGSGVMISKEETHRDKKGNIEYYKNTDRNGDTTRIQGVVTIYNSKGKLILRRNGNFIDGYVYDSHGNCIEDSTNHDDIHHSWSMYDKKHRLIQVRTVRSSDEYSLTKYSYNVNGEVDSIYRTGCRGSINDTPCCDTTLAIFYRDSLGSIVKETRKGNNYTELKKSIHTNDKIIYVTCSFSYNDRSHCLPIDSTFYDLRGRLIVSRQYGCGGTYYHPIARVVREVARNYNESGLLVEENFFEDDMGIYRTKAIYEYEYDN